MLDRCRFSVFFRSAKASPFRKSPPWVSVQKALTIGSTSLLGAAPSPSKLQSSIIPAPVHTKHPWFGKLFSKNLGPFMCCFIFRGWDSLPVEFLGVRKQHPNFPNFEVKFLDLRSFTMNMLWGAQFWHVPMLVGGWALRWLNGNLWWLNGN